MTTTKRGAEPQAQPARGLRAFSDNRYSVARVNTRAAKIWPGPPTTRAQRIAALMQCGRSEEAARSIVATADAMMQRVEMNRAHAIAKAHERARAAAAARNVRWRKWLIANGACWEALELAAKSRTPEDAVLSEARDGSPFSGTWWLARRVLGRRPAEDLWDRVWIPGSIGAIYEARARELLASTEWASLPWQRDPSEVARG
jgi:hypothetical protein